MWGKIMSMRSCLRRFGEILPSLDESHDVSLVGFVGVVQRLEDFHFFPVSGFTMHFHHAFHYVNHKESQRYASQRWNSHCYVSRVGLGALLCSFFHHIVGANDLQRLGCSRCRQGMPWSLRETSEPDTLQLRHHQRFTL